MTNTATNNYIEVTSNLIVMRGIYQVVLNFYIDGKRKQKWKSLKIKAISGNKTLAKRKQKEVERDFEEELNTPKETTECKGATILFGKYMEEWLETMKPRVELSTFPSYENKVKIISKYFNDLGIKLCDLKKSHIKTFYNYLMQTRNIKPQTVKRYHANIHKALKEAVELDLIPINPSDNIDLNKSEQYIASYYNKEDLEKLFEVAKGSIIELHILLAAHYGLRRSETCGLKFNAINFIDHTITISHTVTQCNIDGQYTTVKKDRTKNKSSYRTLPLVPVIEDLLLKEKAKQEENKKIFGNTYKNKEGYILVDDEGNLIKPDRVTKTFKKLIVRNNLKNIRFHDLRHSCASLLLANGINMKEIQLYLGHSSFNTTANLYSHVDSSSNVKSANIMASVLSV